jgi:hypothetical protein
VRGSLGVDGAKTAHSDSDCELSLATTCILLSRSALLRSTSPQLMNKYLPKLSQALQEAYEQRFKYIPRSSWEEFDSKGEVHGWPGNATSPLSVPRRFLAT